MLLQEYSIMRKLPKHGFDKLLGAIKIMEFKNHSSFIIKRTVEKQEISIMSQRTGVDWKITKIDFPLNLLKNLI